MKKNVHNTAPSNSIKLACDWTSVLTLGEQERLTFDVKKMLDGAIMNYHENNADFIYWLAQYDDRKLFLEDGYSSTYDFLVRGHNISEGSAWRRIRVARLSKRHPPILEAIAKGQISFSVLSLIAEADLVDEMAPSVIDQCRNKTKKEAEKILALLQSKPVDSRKHRDSVRIVGSKWKENEHKQHQPGEHKSDSIHHIDPISVAHGTQDCSQPAGAEPTFSEETSDNGKPFPSCPTPKCVDANQEVTEKNGQLLQISGVFTGGNNFPGADRKSDINQNQNHDNTGLLEKELIYRISVDLPETIYDQLMHAKVMCNASDLAALISNLLDVYVSKLPEYKRRTFGMPHGLAIHHSESSISSRSSTASPNMTGTTPARQSSRKIIEKPKDQRSNEDLKIKSEDELNPIGRCNEETATTDCGLRHNNKRKNQTNPKNATGGGQSNTLQSQNQTSPENATGGGIALRPRTEGRPSPLLASSHTNNLTPVARSRYIPAEMKKYIWAKFSGRCGFVSPVTGQRCRSIKNLEFEHIRPYAKGGNHDQNNLMLLCRAHNQFQAIREFGSEKMAAWISV
jgi:hypothetical protein